MVDVFFYTNDTLGGRIKSLNWEKHLKPRKGYKCLSQWGSITFSSIKHPKMVIFFIKTDEPETVKKQYSNSLAAMTRLSLILISRI